MGIGLLTASLLLSIAAAPAATGKIPLSPCAIPGTDASMSCGVYEVFEDREARIGRKISLQIAVVPAEAERRKPDPVFMLAGGPGQSATRLAQWMKKSWMRDPARDFVLVDRRGTGNSNGLDCDLLGPGEDLLSVLGNVFEDPEPIRRCRKDLEKRADLRLYTTPIAMDDLDEVRRALGYDRINLVGGSWGTRAALVYIRRHGEHVRAAVLSAPAPIALTAPLFHARDAQRSLDLILDECAADPPCHAAFPEVRKEFKAVLERLAEKPARVSLPGTNGSGGMEVRLTGEAFAEAFRILMYTTAGTRRLPRLIHSASQGDLVPFAQAGIAGLQGMLRQIDLGLMLSVVCSEDVPRINPDDIPEMTAGTFLGDARLRTQMTICGDWPRGKVPESYGEPVRSSVPVLVITGNLDPITPPAWGEETVRHLSKGRHITVPRAHDFNSPCVAGIAGSFLHGDPLADLDTSCIAGMSLPPFELSD
jgi:pimeloyl-ACP methyl ester carboxylesterase